MSKFIININDYSFRIMNKTTYEVDRIIVNIHSSESTNKNLLYDDNTIDEKVNKFSVYLSRSNLGCFRLLYITYGHYAKGHEDYIQQTFIHLELNDYINKCVPILSDVDYDYTDRSLNVYRYLQQNDTNFNMSKNNIFNMLNNSIFIQNLKNIKNHIDDNSRMIKKNPFIEYNQQIRCGHEKKEDKNTIIKILRDFSNKLTDLYNYSENNFVCEHTVNNELDNFKIQFYKLNLNLKQKDYSNIDNIILYYCNVEIEKFNGLITNSYIKTDRKNFKLPVFLTSDNKITKFGTFTNYILAGNYICKLFEYREQCKDQLCTFKYQLIGDRYDNIFPFNIIKEPIEPQKTLVIPVQPTRPVQLQINNSIDELNDLINNYLKIIQTGRKIIQTGNIIWSDSTILNLQFINSGVPNAAYYDTKLQGVVKFKKTNSKDIKSTLIDKIQSKDDIEKNKEEYDNIMNNINKLKDLDFINKLNTLETFCHMKGYVIYHNINYLFMNIYNIAHSPLIEYLVDYNDFYGFTKDEDEDKIKALPSFLEVVKDFNTFNTEFMFKHGDLQNNCRNIMYNKITNKFKVIDIVSPSLIIPSRPDQLNSLISEIIFDIKSLINCYKNTWKLEIDIDNLININKLEIELMSDNNNLFCVKYLNKDPFIEYNPYRSDCKKRDIYVDTSKEVVKQIILKFINECYTNFISIIEEDILIINKY
jgi:hypothetical protein